MDLVFQYYILYICTTQTIAEYEEIFEEDADAIFKSELGDINKITKSNIDPKKYLEKLKNDNKRKMLNIRNGITTTEKAKPITRHPVKRTEDITIEDLNARRVNIKIAKILNHNFNPIPNFNNNDDDLSIITRIFDGIRRKIKEEDENARKSFLRVEYFAGENESVVIPEKNKTLALMEHYVYETRYKLPYAQLMRKKYRSNIRYKLGYCFALLRQLKQQQMLIYSTLVNHYLRTTSLHFHMKMYEKVIRLDVDIKDLILFIRRMERARKLKKDPHYYDT